MTATVHDPLYSPGDNAASNTKSSFDLEPNPFEQSFASKKASKASSVVSANSSQLQQLDVPQNQSNQQSQPQQVPTGTTPQIYTPGGRKLPPLVLSPNAPSTWSTAGFPRTGLTPNESSLRSGLTPGGNTNASAAAAAASFAQGLSLRGLTPGGLGFSSFTPGLSSLLGTEQPTQLPQDPTGQLQQPGTENKQPAKRGRKKGSVTKKEEPLKKKMKNKLKIEEKDEKNENNEDSISNNNEGDGDELEDDEKRKNFLERNRVAASKCRQRKKQQQQKMEQDLNFYLNEYNELTSSIDQLKEQSAILRSLLINNKVNNPDILGLVDNISTIIDNTNYASRLRGNNPTNMIPTVQPINPALIQQNQAQLQAQLQQQQQQQQQQAVEAQMNGVMPPRGGVIHVPMPLGQVHSLLQPNSSRIPNSVAGVVIPNGKEGF